MQKGEPGEWNYKTGHGSLCDLQKKYSPLLDKWCYHCGEMQEFRRLRLLKGTTAGFYAAAAWDSVCPFQGLEQKQLWVCAYMSVFSGNFLTRHQKLYQWLQDDITDSFWLMRLVTAYLL